jgi:hypothetical protein
MVLAHKKSESWVEDVQKLERKRCTNLKASSMSHLVLTYEAAALRILEPQDLFQMSCDKQQERRNTMDTRSCAPKPPHDRVRYFSYQGTPRHEPQEANRKSSLLLPLSVVVFT